MFASLSLYKSDASSIATISDSLTSSLSSVTRLVLPLIAVAILVMGVAQLFRRHYGAAFLAIAAAGGAVALSFLLPQVTAAFSDSVSPSAKPTRTPTSTPTPTPTSTAPDATAPAAQPIDMSWIWIVLGVIVAMVVCVAAICLAVWAIGAARARRRERLKQVAAERQVIERLTAKWQQIRDRHNGLLRLYLSAETDWDSLFFTPALTDPTVPATGRMLQAMRDANTLRDTSGDLPTNLTADTDLTRLPYPRAVDAFGLAWDAAVSNARRLGQNGIPAAERKLIKEIRQLLNVAEDSAAGDVERNLAYRRAQSLIESLESIHVPQKAMEQLEERKLLQLTAATVEAQR